MKNNTYIILLPIQNGNCRTQLEFFENETFKSDQQAINYISNIGCKNFLTFPISSFMDFCNNEEFNPNEFWLGYINILE